MISLLLTLICVIAIIALLCVIAIPQLTASVKSIAALVQEKWPDWVGLLQRYGIDTEKLSAHFAALDWKSILQSISSEMNTVIFPQLPMLLALRYLRLLMLQFHL